MAETVLEAFTRLCRARDLAAYRVVGTLDCAIYACRSGNAAEALDVLTRARVQYELADTDLENFKRLHFNQKKGEPHGNRTAAA